MKLLSIIILNPLSSIFNKKYDNLENKFFSYKKTVNFTFNSKGIWILKSDQKHNYIINAININPELKKLSNVTIFKTNEDKFFIGKIYAKEAIIKNKTINLVKGKIFSRYEQVKEFKNLKININKTIMDFEILSDKPETLDIIELYKYIKLMRSSGLNISNHLIHFLKLNYL